MERRAERRDCPMLVGMVTWPGERETGRWGGRGGPLSLGSSLSAAGLFPQSPSGLCVSSLPSGLLWRNRTHLASS